MARWMWWWCGLVGGAGLAAAGRWWCSRAWGRAAALGPNALRGRTAIVTGASGGLGAAAAEALFGAGARVVLACRDVSKARRLVAAIRERHPTGGEAIVMHLDLESFDSIRSFADLVKTAFSKIDILINNAGVYLPTTVYEITREGHEKHFGVNHLGHFLLTGLLLDLLKNATPSRIVIVSSLLHEKGEIDFEDLNLRRMFDRLKNGDKTIKKKFGRHNPGYCNTKLMNVYFGRGLAERTKGTGVDVFTVCPGFTYTGLFRYSLRWYHFFFMAPFILLFLRTPKQGVQTIIHCATDPSLKGKSGGFYRNCAPYQSKITFDKTVEDKLWDVSEELVKPKLKIA